MNFRCYSIKSWPKLTWVARIPPGSSEVFILHGPMVETSNEWAVEAVWAGDFAAGDFDHTDLVFGTGVRLRQDTVVFVNSGTSLDRLWYCKRNGMLFVSNSLPAMLAVAGLSLRNDVDYTALMRTAKEGLSGYARDVPVTDGYVHPQYFHNLTFSHGVLHEIEKPKSIDGFTEFDSYWRYMQQVARDLGENMRAPQRTHRIAPLTTASTGYDSCVAAVLAKEAGCEKAVTIAESNSLWRGSDSGMKIATMLDLLCQEYSLRPNACPDEHAVWAVSGLPMEINWTQFEYPQPLTLFFTGCHGDKVWARAGHDVSRPFSKVSLAGIGLCEWRLLHGVFHCPVPFWGVRCIRDIRRISNSSEITPWSLGGEYDRPIARCILERSDVPRKAFGMRKKNTSLENPFRWPISKKARQQFKNYLRKRKVYAPSSIIIDIIRIIAMADSIIYKSTLKKMGKPKGKRPWDKLKAPQLIFQWANSELKTLYQRGFSSSSRFLSHQKET